MVVGGDIILFEMTFRTGTNTGLTHGIGIPIKLFVNSTKLLEWF